MSNHLIIGLGGTGGKVIRNIRKAIYRDWRPAMMGISPHSNDDSIDRAARATPPGLKVDYLYVDTSKEFMNPSDLSWKLFGENLQLSPSGQLHLEGGDLKARVGNIHAYPALEPWIGTSGRWNSILNQGGTGTELAAQQKRRLGRFLLAVNAKAFVDKVIQKVKQIQEGSMEKSVQIHVVCGLAGGTGSGTVIDIVSMIRKNYPNDKDFPILLYALLPEEHPHPNWAKPNYHANGYAGLIELNALHVGSYFPIDLTGSGDRYKELASPFNICFLVTNENSNGSPFEVDIEIPSLMAEILYHMIVAQSSAIAQQGGGGLNRVINWENMTTDAEESQRSRRFASFGYRRISYPEEEIKEFVGYTLSEQTLLQMLYNNWAQRYLGENSEAFAVEGLVADSTTQKRYNLDREVFFLERQFSTEEVDKDQKTWKAFEADWRSYIERLSADIVAGDDNWLDTLKRKCEERQKKSFREGKGVMDYYNWKMGQIQEYGRLVVSGIEEDLCKDLLAGNRALTEIESIVRSLCKVLDKRQMEWSKEIEEDSSHAAKQRILFVENTQRFEDMGLIARKIARNKERIFEAGKNAMISYFSLSTRITAWEFASELIRSIKAELHRIADHVANVVAAYRTAVSHCAERAGEHRPEEKNLRSNEVVMRLFNGDEVTRYVEALIGNKDFQDKQARRARERMVEILMAGRKLLRKLPTAEKNNELLDILAQSSHETLAAFDVEADGSEKINQTFGRLFSVSIIDKLRERYSGNPDLMKSEIRDHMKKAGYLLKINNAERGMEGPGTQFINDNIEENWIVLMPDAEKDDPFIKNLIEAFKDSRPDTKRVQFIDTKDTRRHEITILSFVQLFPLRYVDLVGKLREKYESRLLQDRDQAILELHTEDPSDRFCPLFIPPVKDLVGPALLLGMALGVVRPKSIAGVAGSIKDSLVLETDSGDLENLGCGFENSISPCATREKYKLLTEANRKRCQSGCLSSQGVDDIRKQIDEIAAKIAEGDDDLRIMMRNFKAAAVDQYEKYLSAKPA